MRALAWFGAIVAVFALIVGLELSHFGNLFDSGNITAPAHTLTLAGARVSVTLAQTPAEQERGLGGRDSLGQGEGMLFVFPQDGAYAFWMKDMRFSIDIIWLDSYGKVVYVVPDLSPATYPRSYASPTPARFVLEVPAGWAAAHQVRVGDRARLP